MPNTSTPLLYGEYLTSMHAIADVRYASAVLQWDQETYLPPKGAAMRGQQIATLSEIAHKLFTDEKLGNLLQELNSRNDLSPSEKRNVQLTLEDYTRQKKFDSSFVRQLTETINKSFHSWIEARKANNFAVFAKDLSELLTLKKKEAELLGYQQHPYDALLDDHDKGSTVQLLDKVFSDIRTPLKELLSKIQSRPQVDNSILTQTFESKKQWDFGMQVLKELGYDFEAGRQDIAEHPFTTNFNSNDVRITTRIDEHDLGNMTWSTIHELGHALYEQGLPSDQYGLPLGEAASFTIHESQSRLWENHVGRSLAFCEKYFPVLQQYFPAQLSTVTAEQFYKAINKIEPSLIRTEADELTYHFHIMIRYELEKALLEGSLQVNDIPAYWNEKYAEYLGVKVPDDKRGCLQDVHWSHGSFGYFPTYSLGSFYAAQFYGTAQQAIPGLNSQVQNGNTTSLLQWLRTQVHASGRFYTSEQLSSKVNGSTLNTTHFMGYLTDKYKAIYGF
ncbi:MAG: carboxypeptidase M32 [Chitinophagaceae bacterium]